MLDDCRSAMRIIPAYAGSTEATARPSGSRGDHPRVCGEHLMKGAELPEMSGSSPRMRGAPQSCRRRSIGTGIIPAYAGSTRNAPKREHERENHPRVCGEHPSDGGRNTKVAGSSPAYAGSTWSMARWRIRARDHPRVCGEHISMTPKTSAFTGSSPRMRGAPSSRFTTSQATWDHPRVCGEHRRSCPPPPSRTGSSPRMRGARLA